MHAMRKIFEEESEAVLMLDASNAFNPVNRETFLNYLRHLPGTSCIRQELLSQQLQTLRNWRGNVLKRRHEINK